MNVFALVVILLILAAFAVDKYVHKQLEKRQLRRCSLVYTLASYPVYLTLMLAVVYTQMRAATSQVVWGGVLAVALAVLLSKVAYGIALVLSLVPKIWRGASWGFVRHAGAVIGFAVLGYFVYSAVVTTRRVEVVDVEFVS